MDPNLKFMSPKSFYYMVEGKVANDELTGFWAYYEIFENMVEVLDNEFVNVSVIIHNKGGVKSLPLNKIRRFNIWK